MKNRSSIVYFVLSIFTFGIFYVYWLISTANEMKAKNADIPTNWFAIIPFVSIYWLFKYAKGVDQVTNHNMEAGLTFLLLFFFGPIWQIFVQNKFNQISSAPITNLNTNQTPANNLTMIPASPTENVTTAPNNPPAPVNPNIPANTLDHSNTPDQNAPNPNTPPPQNPPSNLIQ